MSSDTLNSEDVLAHPGESEMAALECQLNLVDYAQCEYGAEAFQALVLPALALRFPGLAAFEAVRSAS